MTESEEAKLLGVTIGTAKAVGAPIPLGRLGRPDDIAWRFCSRPTSRRG